VAFVLFPKRANAGEFCLRILLAVERAATILGLFQQRMRYLSRGQMRCFVVLGVWTMWLIACELVAAETKRQCVWWPWSKADNAAVGNGIAVDQPKVFDDRSLVLMADQLSVALSKLSVLDQPRLSQGIGVLQGARQSDVSRALSISTLPLPSTELTQQRDATSNQLVPQTLVTSTAGLAPAAPSLPGTALPTLSQTGFGAAAQDILDEQMELSYKILNLRMLIERSITDRIHYEEGKATQRAQAALGFRVSLDPLKQHKRHAAVVEIELSATDPKRMVPALVSLMPQAKTYNMSALSRQANAFGASAVVKVVTVGVSAQSTRQSYYLYRDTDTVAFQRPAAGDGTNLVFGWEFRPVLNRTVVEPGLRQLFAVVALDAPDTSEMAQDLELKVKIRTYWVKYDKKHSVIVSGPCDQRNDDRMPAIKIPCSKSFHQGLGPEITALNVEPTGPNSVVVDIRGNNFYEGTSVAIGDRVYDGSHPNFVIKDSHLMQLFVNASDLADNSLVVRGRYGTLAVSDSQAIPDEFQLGIQFESSRLPDNSGVTIRLFPGGGDEAPNLKGQVVLLRIGSQSFVLRPSDWRKLEPKETIEGGKTVKKSGYLATHIHTVDSSLLTSNVVAVASIPLVPSRRSEILVSTPVAVDSAVVLVDSDPQTWGITGRGFNTIFDHAATRVIADKTYAKGSGLTLLTPNLVQFQVDRKAAAQIKTLVVTLGPTKPVMLPTPKVTSAPAKVTLAPGQAITAAVDSAPAIQISGANLTEVTNVFFSTTVLKFSPENSGKTLRVFLNRDVTAKQGTATLAIQLKDNSLLSQDITIQQPN
jgi:hypothetical protein